MIAMIDIQKRRVSPRARSSDRVGQGSPPVTAFAAAVHDASARNGITPISTTSTARKAPGPPQQPEGRVMWPCAGNPRGRGPENVTDEAEGIGRRREARRGWRGPGRGIGDFPPSRLWACPLEHQFLREKAVEERNAAIESAATVPIEKVIGIPVSASAPSRLMSRGMGPSWVDDAGGS